MLFSKYFLSLIRFLYVAILLISFDSHALDRFRPISQDLYRSAEPSEEDFDSLNDFGISVIVNLQNDPSVETLHNLSIKSGFEFYNLPLQSASTDQDYENAMAHFFRIIDEAKSSGKKVLIQCKHGKDRTGLMAALYRVLREHWSPEEAFAEWKKYGLSDEWGKGIQEFYWKTVGTLEDRIIADPVSYYLWARTRLTEKGPNASFPEFEESYKKILKDLEADWFLDVINKSSELKQKLEHVKAQLFHVNLEFTYENKEKYPYEQPFDGKFPYRPTIDAFEDAMQLFDIVDRIRNEKSTEPLYHFDRYLYHRHKMIADPRVVIIPTFKSLGFNPLIKVRAVPIGFIGLSTQGLRVDRHYQTPLDFWYHDLNHVRRMVEYLFLVMRQNGIKTLDDEMEMYRRMDRFIQYTLMPHIQKIPLKADREEYAKRAMLRVLIFEILHESALPPTRDAILDDLMRPPGVEQPFEVQLKNVTSSEFHNEDLRTETGNLESGARKTGLSKDSPITIHNIHDRALSLLANVLNKLHHGFFDDPEDPQNYVVPVEYRTPEQILNAAKELFTILDYKNYPDDEMLLGWITSKDGSPEKFSYKSISIDPEKQKKSKNELKVQPTTITEPLALNKAILIVEKIKKEKEVITFLGYSAMEYEHPEIVDELIIRSLKNFDPKKHIINSGSTKEGISRVYELAKMMGFETMGLVATRALRFSGQFSEYVDHHIIFDTDQYGGKDKLGGQLSEVSEAFIRASDRIIAIGGNTYTGIILEEADKRGIPVEYYSAEMNHDAARRQSLYKRTDLPSDFFGEAFKVWKVLAKNKVHQQKDSLCNQALEK